jgi:hypothetical protein
MTSGIDWNEGLPYIDPRNSAVQMEASYDWVSYVINRPMAEEPGTARQERRNRASPGGSSETRATPPTMSGAVRDSVDSSRSPSPAVIC